MAKMRKPIFFFQQTPSICQMLLTHEFWAKLFSLVHCWRHEKISGSWFPSVAEAGKFPVNLGQSPENIA
jgi:hypothetical protein